VKLTTLQYGTLVQGQEYCLELSVS
jgi:hypothetical protein